MILDGVLLNKKELLDNSSCDNLKEWVYQHVVRGEQIYTELRGPFDGCICDLENDILYAFGNQTGDTAVFYYSDDNCFAVSSDFNMVFDFCKKNNKILSFNKTAANHIISLGYVVEGNTFANEIHRVKPGNLVSVYGNNVREESYYRIDNTHIQNISMEEAIEQLDKGFRKAVKRCFDKDLEYGYTHHLADMSGGLDSRMTTWVAKDMGYTDITNISYAKADSDEERCARNVTVELNNEFIFKQLDDLSFFYDIEDIINKNYGLALYSGITGGNRLLSDLNFDKFGLEHTGQLGDVIIGSYSKDLTHRDAINPTAISYSDFVSPILCNSNDFNDHEMFAMYYRGFQGILSTHFIRSKYTLAVSPFIDVDFINLCFSFPLEYRINHNLYFKWLYKKYPEAASVPSTTVDPQKAKKTWRDVGRKLVGKNKRAVVSFLKKHKLYFFIEDPNTMNPLDYWYYKNSKIRGFMNKYYEDHIALLDDYPDTQETVTKVFNAERANDKVLALTVLGVYAVYWGEQENGKQAAV